MHTDEEFDEFVRTYKERRPEHKSFSLELENLVRRILKERNIKFQIVTSRTKEVSSFGKKCRNIHEDGDLKGELKYQDPLKQIEDLSGVRVICSTISDRQKIVQALTERFYVAESSDVGEVRFQQGKFGYQSHHLIAKLKTDLLEYPGYSQFKDFKCEIQIRTVLQHAWAEIEHDIRYKSERDLPEQTKIDFTALAGLLVIADKEFERIKKEDALYTANVSESIDDIIQSTSLLEKKSGRGSKARSKAAATQPTRVRELLDSGQYEKAIIRYTELIEAEPKSYNLYLGRANAYFLSGEITKALSDIDASEEIRGKEPEVFDAIRDKINSVKLNTDLPKVFQSEMVEKGNKAILGGDPKAAFEYYSRAQDQGYSRPYSNFNKAMSCCLGREYDGTEYYLNKLEFRPGTFVSVHMVGLRWINAVLKGSENVQFMEKEYQNALADITEYDSNLSPLRKLEKGFIAMKDKRYKMLKPVFEIINK